MIKQYGLEFKEKCRGMNTIGNEVRKWAALRDELQMKSFKTLPIHNAGRSK